MRVMFHLRIAIVAVLTGQSLALSIVKPRVSRPIADANCRQDLELANSLDRLADFFSKQSHHLRGSSGRYCEGIRDHYNDTFPLEQLYVQLAPHAFQPD